MNVQTLVIALVAAILGGGGVGALLPVFRYRADKGNVIAVGAEAAVASLTAALVRSDTRVSNLEAENKMQLITIEEMKIKFDGELTRLRSDLAQALTRIDQIQKEQR